jgi:hypothetical protein
LFTLRSPGRSQAPHRQKRPPIFPGERFLFQPCLVVFVSSVTLGERKAIVEADRWDGVDVRVLDGN